LHSGIKLIILVLSILVVVVGIAALNWILAFGASADRSWCVDKLRIAVYPAMKEYADAHEGRYPDKLSVLYPKYISNLDFFVCPEVHVDLDEKPAENEIDSLSSYVIVPGLSKEGVGNVALVYEREDNHPGWGRAILYLNGKAERLKQEEWPTIPSVSE
jgi:hypothetical protein